MERFNPFANTSDLTEDPFGATFNRSTRQPQEQPPSQAIQDALAHSDAPRRLAHDDTSAPLEQAGYATADAVAPAPGQRQQQQPPPPPLARYSTSFPDPFGESAGRLGPSETTRSSGGLARGAFAAGPSGSAPAVNAAPMTNRSNSVTFAPSLEAHAGGAETSTASGLSGRGRRTGASPSGASSGGFTSFLSRATSVTSSSVTDRVSGAVGSVRSAVDSISSQLQQAVPSNLNERLASTATNLISSSNESQVGGQPGASTVSAQGQQQQQTQAQQSQQQQQQQQQQTQQQSAASYLASKFSSAAVGQFVVGSSSGPGSSSLAVISRQRVILILDSLSNTDWAQQFCHYYKLTSGSGGGQLSAQSSLTSFFTSATAQLTSASSSANLQATGDDLVEQADFRDISVLANQATSAATIYVSNKLNRNHQFLSSRSSSTSTTAGGMLGAFTSSIGSSAAQSSGAAAGGAGKIIRPEYVVIRQRSKERLEHLRAIVAALNYCLVPMFEPIEIWNTFQERQLLFSRLLRVQKALGKENFPLIPQIYCQTHLDLLNYIQSSTVTLPCLACTGPLGQGKIKIDNLQMLKDFASIMETSNLGCTLEPYLNVKCDLIVQKLGTSLKLFRRANPSQNLQQQTSCDQNNTTTAAAGGSQIVDALGSSFERDKQEQQFSNNSTSPGQSSIRQMASRQTSLGSSVFSSLISSTRSVQDQQHQLAATRRSSGSSTTPGSYERMSEAAVSVRYRNWVEAIGREFDNKLEAFCIKILVANNDREYIIGLNDCSMDFLGSPENQEEDRRSFVELVISNMNTILPKCQQSANKTNEIQSSPGATAIATPLVREFSGERAAGGQSIQKQSTPVVGHHQQRPQLMGQAHMDMSTPLGDKKRFTSQSQIVDGSSRARETGSYSSRPGGYGHLGSRSQSVSVNQSDFLADQHQQDGAQAPYFARRGSDRADSLVLGADDSSSYSLRDSQTLNTSSGSGSTTGLHQRQASLGQTFLDQTSTALNSIHKQSLSFFRRLDTGRADLVSSTPPESAKSDKAFDRFGLAGGPNEAHVVGGPGHHGATGGARNGGFKSQSIDSSSLDSSASFVGRHGGSLRRREPPPKPPPPPIGPGGYRQSPLMSHSLQRASSSATTTPNSTPIKSVSRSSGGSGVGGCVGGGTDNQPASNSLRNRVVRQNSALSAFEPFDTDLETSKGSPREDGNVVDDTSSAYERDGEVPKADNSSSRLDKPVKPLDSTKKANFDSVSITSGDSNSTGETTTAEDTMNNLKKTFASIFGDKCE